MSMFMQPVKTCMSWIFNACGTKSYREKNEDKERDAAVAAASQSSGSY